jgi:uncharacterized protein
MEEIIPQTESSDPGSGGGQLENPGPERPAARPLELRLTAAEVRVLGALVEKSLTTPEYYPLTLNALTAACNQKSNRDPLMQMDDKAVVLALDGLRDKKLAWTVSVAGSRVAKYQHSVMDVLHVNPVQLAVLCELMLRGPQTAGELKTHASRMASLSEPAEVQTILQDLLRWPEGQLVYRLGRQAGQREERFGHCLCGPPPEEPVIAPPLEPARLAVAADNERIAALEQRVGALESVIAELRAQLKTFVDQF